MVQSVREVIEIARRVGCALEISHFKSCGMKNWGKDIHTAIADIEAARAEGMDVTVDFYPYEGGSTALTTMLPPVFVAGNMTRALEKLAPPKVWRSSAVPAACCTMTGTTSASRWLGPHHHQRRGLPRKREVPGHAGDGGCREIRL